DPFVFFRQPAASPFTVIMRILVRHTVYRVIFNTPNILMYLRVPIAWETATIIIHTAEIHFVGHFVFINPESIRVALLGCFSIGKWKNAGWNVHHHSAV